MTSDEKLHMLNDLTYINKQVYRCSIISSMKAEYNHLKKIQHTIIDSTSISDDGTFCIYGSTDRLERLREEEIDRMERIAELQDELKNLEEYYV